MTEWKMTRRNVLFSAAAAFASCYSHIKVEAANANKFPELDHNLFMRLAIEQAKKVPECPFGSVVVNIKTKKVQAEGWVQVEKNPIWHGEMTAIRNCPDGDKSFNWQDMCLYTTGESCPMCQSAIVWTKMPLVVYGSSIPFLQTCDFGQINIRAQTVVNASRYGKCTIIGGVLADECNELFKHAKKLNDRKA